MRIPRALGIDVGGTKVALALGDEEGRVLARARRPTDPSGRPEDDLARMADDAKKLLAEAGVSLSQLDAVGVCVPGALDEDRGIVINPPNLAGWDRVPVRDILSDAFGRPVHVHNDGNAAALAEWKFGAGKGFSDVVYLTMSTGIGGGIVLGGRLHRGTHASAGEVGHIPVEWGGELCACGCRGCLEAYSGGAAWAKRLRAIAPEDGRVAELAGGRENAKPEHVEAAAREGDAFALAEFDRFNEYLARGIAALTFLLAPQVVILGTIATAAGEDLVFRPVRERVAAYTWPVFHENLRIVPAALGRDVGEVAGICAGLEGIGAI